jgi:nitroimidazol reductase NimA-like FMN-containing flavoprotein (pyridoxamine 5'-phosphate oxidase superfamily)
MRLKAPIVKLIEWERICHVATASAAGVPHVVPVCHVLADGKLYFASETGARKMKNLRENPHVTVTVDLYSEDWSHLKGVMIQGSATIVDKRRFRKIRGLLYKKYPQYPDVSAIGERDSVIVEVSPRHAFSWGMNG